MASSNWVWLNLYFTAQPFGFGKCCEDDSIVKKEEEGKSAQGGSRTRTTLRSEDFLTHYRFHDQLALFGVWTMPSP